MLVVAYVCANTQKQNQKKKYQILALVPSQEGLPWWLMGKESACQCKRHGFDLWVKKIPWRGKWQPSPVFLPGKSSGWRSLANYSPWVAKSRTRLSDFTFTLCDSIILLFNLILLTMLIRLLNQTSILGKFIGWGTAFFLRIANAIETF